MNIWKVGGDDRPFLPARRPPLPNSSLAPQICNVEFYLILKMENEDSQKKKMKCSSEKTAPKSRVLDDEEKKCEKCTLRHGCTWLLGEKILNIVQGMVRYALGNFLMNYTGPPIIHCYSNVKMKNGMAREMTQGPD